MRYKLGIASFIEHWNTIVVSINDKKLVSMINDKANVTLYKKLKVHQDKLLLNLWKI